MILTITNYEEAKRKAQELQHRLYYRERWGYLIPERDFDEKIVEEAPGNQLIEDFRPPIEKMFSTVKMLIRENADGEVYHAARALIRYGRSLLKDEQ